MIKNLKTKSKLLVLTVINLFKARIRPTYLYATTEEENGRFVCGTYELMTPLHLLCGERLRVIFLCTYNVCVRENASESVIG